MILLKISEVLIIFNELFFDYLIENSIFFQNGFEKFGHPLEIEREDFLASQKNLAGFIKNTKKFNFFQKIIK